MIYLVTWSIRNFCSSSLFWWLNWIVVVKWMTTHKYSFTDLIFLHKCRYLGQSWNYFLHCSTNHCALHWVSDCYSLLVFWLHGRKQKYFLQDIKKHFEAKSHSEQFLQWYTYSFCLLLSLPQSRDLSVYPRQKDRYILLFQLALL